MFRGNTALNLLHINKDRHIDIKFATESFLENHGHDGKKVFEPWHELSVAETQAYSPPRQPTHSEAMLAENNIDDHYCELPPNDVMEKEADNDFSFRSFLDEIDQEN